MYAALYADADSVRLLLNHGADPNISNDAGATALMWAVEDPEKIRLLLRHGANVDVRSADGQTPLITAAGRYGAGAAVKLLLEGGANPSEKASDGGTPLGAAAFAADDVVIQMLIDHGAEVQAPAYASARAGCAKCVATLMRPAGGNVSNPTVVPAVAFAYPSILKMLLDYGAVIKADAKMTDMTCLMFAAVSDALPVGIARDLIERGADLNVLVQREMESWRAPLSSIAPILPGDFATEKQWRPAEGQRLNLQLVSKRNQVGSPFTTGRARDRKTNWLRSEY
jgi:ankyrin repeat protein